MKVTFLSNKKNVIRKNEKNKLFFVPIYFQKFLKYSSLKMFIIELLIFKNIYI